MMFSLGLHSFMLPGIWPQLFVLAPVISFLSSVYIFDINSLYSIHPESFSRYPLLKDINLPTSHVIDPSILLDQVGAVHGFNLHWS